MLRESDAARFCLPRRLALCWRGWPHDPFMHSDPLFVNVGRGLVGLNDVRVDMRDLLAYLTDNVYRIRDTRWCKAYLIGRAGLWCVFHGLATIINTTLEKKPDIIMAPQAFLVRGICSGFPNSWCDLPQHVYQLWSDSKYTLSYWLFSTNDHEEWVQAQVLAGTEE